MEQPTISWHWALLALAGAIGCTSHAASNPPPKETRSLAPATSVPLASAKLNATGPAAGQETTLSPPGWSFEIDPAAGDNPRALLPRSDERRKLAPQPIDMAKVPLVVTTPPLGQLPAPEQLPAALRAPSPLDAVENALGLQVPERDDVLAQLEASSIGLAPVAANRRYLSCGSESTPPKPVRWTVLSPHKDGMELRITDAWAKATRGTCDYAVAREIVVRPAPILGGLLGLLRVRCDACVEKNFVMIVAPSMRRLSVDGQALPVDLVEPMAFAWAPIGPGQNHLISGEVVLYSYEQWRRVLKPNTVALHPSTHTLRFELNITQASDEAQPSALAHAIVGITEHAANSLDVPH